MSLLERFNYQIIGQESVRKLVFLHGLLGNLANWRRITPSFKEDFQILTFDQRGHGRSFHPKTGYAPEDYAKDLFEILGELNWQKVDLVGHSMGGRNALSFANIWPDRVNKLVIEDIAPISSDVAVANLKKLLSLVPVPFASRLEAKEFFASRFPQLIQGRPQPQILSQYLYSNIVEEASGRAVWRFSLSGVIESIEQGRSQDRWDQVKNLKCPTLVIRGQNSQELSPEDYHTMMGASSMVSGVVISGAGHWVHSDQPEEFIQEVKNFLLKE